MTIIMVLPLSVLILVLLYLLVFITVSYVDYLFSLTHLCFIAFL